MSKSPYEIRLDLLEMSIGILTQQAETMNTEKLTNAEKDGSSISLTNMPTTEQIMVEAKKMNVFVSDGVCECADCDCNPCEC